MNVVDCKCLALRMSSLVMRCSETSGTKMCYCKRVRHEAILVIISIRGLAKNSKSF